MGGTAPSHVSEKNDLQSIERARVGTMSSGVAALNQDGPSPCLVAWDGRPWALQEQVEGCDGKAELI